MTWYTEEFSSRTRFGLKVNETLFEGQSDFQKVEVLDTNFFGRVLVIDGVFMTSELDEFFYHEMIVHPALCALAAPRDVLIIGGGDGGTAREVLRHRDVERVTMVEIDALVVEASKRFLPAIGSAWSDPRLDLRIGDGIQFVRKAEPNQFDAVIVDGTDPVGPAEGLFTYAFYRDVKRVLKPSGALSFQSESPLFFPKVHGELQAMAKELFVHAHPCFGPAPLYSAGQWSWTVASDEIDPRLPIDARAQKIASESKHYTAGIHRAAFVLPNRLRRATT